MKNSTLGRKPGNDMHWSMKPPARPVRKSNQSGDGESFAFNGQMGAGVNRSATTDRASHNTWSGHSNDGRDVNFGLMQSQRTGNASSSPMRVGPPATRDPHAMTIATAAGGMPSGSGMGMPRPPANPDKINIGR